MRVRVMTMTTTLAFPVSLAGLGQLLRLIFIAERCPPLRVEALRTAITLVQNTFNVGLYQSLHRQLQDAVA